MRLLTVEALRSLLRNSARSALAMLGIMIGVATVICVIAIGRAGTAIARALGWDITVSGQASVSAFLAAVAVGVFFGLYPAVRASRLDPIEALRTEGG